MTKWSKPQECQVGFISESQSMELNTLIKEKNHMIILLEAENVTKMH